MRKALVALILLAIWTPSALAIEIVCHRGANEYAPENTRAATQLCIDWQVAYVEIDVRTSKDKVLYILHDATVDRTTNGTGRIRDLTSEQIDQLDAGSWFDPKFAGEKVPRLEPYLRWTKGKIKVYFDVKDCDLAQLIALVYELGLEEESFFYCSNPLHALEFRRLDKNLKLKVNVRDERGLAEARRVFNAAIVEVDMPGLNPGILKACRDAGVKLMVYHPHKDAEAYRQMIALDVDMVNIDHADLFQQLQKEEVGQSP